MRIFSLGRKNTILVKKECTYEVLTKEFPPTGIGVLEPRTSTGFMDRQLVL